MRFFFFFIVQISANHLLYGILYIYLKGNILSHLDLGALALNLNLNHYFILISKNSRYTSSHCELVYLLFLINGENENVDASPEAMRNNVIILGIHQHHLTKFSVYSTRCELVDLLSVLRQHLMLTQTSYH